MKFMFVTRLFTGLETSAKAAKWQPTGVPTIYKIIERIADSSHDLTLIWTCKDTYSSWGTDQDQELRLAGLDADVHILSGKKKFPEFFGHKLRFIFRELRHVLLTIKLYRTLKPDLIYVDNPNVYVGSLLSRFTKTPVVFRVMGVYPAMKKALSGNRIDYKVLRWCYGSPFRSVICTQDASGIEPWLKTAIGRRVEIHILVNGVDLITNEHESEAFKGIDGNKTLFLFVGKLTDAKGALQFLNGFLALWEKYPRKVHALMIGTGEQYEELCRLVKEKSMERDVSIVSRLSHEKIMEAHQISDVYVSLNRFGNLSVANLEAMKSGRCMVFPKSQPDSSVDLVTDKLIPEDAVVRISSTDDIQGLTNALEYLHLNPDKREKYKQKMAAAATFIPSWHERIEVEFDILSDLGRKD
jgi:glycosyltransferase involved in cell wall biosynthesis